MFKKLFESIISGTTGKTETDKRAELYRSLIRHEAKIGGELFGTPPAGVRRDFFCLDEHTVIWHEEWNDESGKLVVKTIRYDIRPNGVFKTANGSQSVPVSAGETRKLHTAVKQYKERASRELYPFVQTS